MKVDVSNKFRTKQGLPHSDIIAFVDSESRSPQNTKNVEKNNFFVTKKCDEMELAAVKVQDQE
jgi:hypothetical protein